jgi:hypothetical protein
LLYLTSQSRRCFDPKLSREGTLDNDVINRFCLLVTQEAGVMSFESVATASIRCPVASAQGQPEE